MALEGRNFTARFGGSNMKKSGLQAMTRFMVLGVAVSAFAIACAPRKKNWKSDKVERDGGGGPPAPPLPSKIQPGKIGGGLSVDANGVQSSTCNTLSPDTGVMTDEGQILRYFQIFNNEVEGKGPQSLGRQSLISQGDNSIVEDYALYMAQNGSTQIIAKNSSSEVIYEFSQGMLSDATNCYFLALRNSELSAEIETIEDDAEYEVALLWKNTGRTDKQVADIRLVSGRLIKLVLGQRGIEGPPAPLPVNALADLPIKGVLVATSNHVEVTGLELSPLNEVGVEKSNSIKSLMEQGSALAWSQQKLTPILSKSGVSIQGKSSLSIVLQSGSHDEDKIRLSVPSVEIEKLVSATEVLNIEVTSQTEVIASMNLKSQLNERVLDSSESSASMNISLDLGEESGTGVLSLAVEIGAEKKMIDPSVIEINEIPQPEEVSEDSADQGVEDNGTEVMENGVEIEESDLEEESIEVEATNSVENSESIEEVDSSESSESEEG